MSIQPFMQSISTNDGRKRCSFSVVNENLGQLDVSVREYNLDQNRFKTEVFDSEKHLLGYDCFDMPVAKPMFDYDITTYPAYRGNGLGEVMRLTSIAQMVENNVDEIDLHSKPTAIYFHAKYGFEPNIKMFSQRMSSLESITNNGLEDGDVFARGANNIIEQISSVTDCTFQQNREFTMKTNELLKAFIKKVLAVGGQDKASFSYGIDMKLTRETVFEKAEFLNGLFKKHGIMFKI